MKRRMVNRFVGNFFAMNFVRGNLVFVRGSSVSESFAGKRLNDV